MILAICEKQMNYLTQNIKKKIASAHRIGTLTSHTSENSSQEISMVWCLATESCLENYAEQIVFTHFFPTLAVSYLIPVVNDSVLSVLMMVICKT